MPRLGTGQIRNGKVNIGIDLQAANSPSDTIDAAPVENSSYPSQLDAALFYAALGWRLFPVNPINKTPLIRAWQTGASTNPETLDSWWSEWPLAMIGVVCGPLSGIAVVDADNKPDANGVTGMEHWGQLQAQHGKPSAIAAKTPSGGMHIYFSAASLPFKKDERGRIAPKVDFRSATPDGDGIGYVILPPSLNSGGVRYEWLEGASEEALQRDRA
jgi:putative DNA primase/helicase